MRKHGLIHTDKRTPNGITKTDKAAQKPDDLIKRDCYAAKPLQKAITDITERPAADGKLYIIAMFNCFDLMQLGLSMDDNMSATLCEGSIKSAVLIYGKPAIQGLIIHSDRGSQYTSKPYPDVLKYPQNTILSEPTVRNSKTRSQVYHRPIPDSVFIKGKPQTSCGG